MRKLASWSQLRGGVSRNHSKQQWTNYYYAVFRIHMFLGLPDPDADPLVRGMDPDPDPSIRKQK